MKELPEKIKIIKEKGGEVGAGFRQQSVGYITAALGLVAGLAWSDAVKSLIDHLFPISKDTVLVKFIYAIIITLFVIIVSRWFISVIRGGKEKDK